MPRTHRPYPPEFRAEAVRLVRESGKPMKVIAQDLGIALESVRNWVRQAEIDAGEREGLTTQEREELQRRRREVKSLREEREILKKAAAFFAKETARYNGPIKLDTKTARFKLHLRAWDGVGSSTHQVSRQRSFWNCSKKRAAYRSCRRS